MSEEISTSDVQIGGKEATGGSAENDNMCGICMEKIVRFGLLSSCDHAFCISCITSWRKEASKSIFLTKEEKNSKRSCPLCREHSDFIISSFEFHKGEEKQEYIAQQLASRSRVPCKEYRTKKECQFGGHCFYAHLDEEGNDIRQQQLQEKKVRPVRTPRIRCPFFYQQRRARLDSDLILLSLMNLTMDIYDHGDYEDDDEDEDDVDVRELYQTSNGWEIDSDMENHIW
eukprot:gene25962-34562_t